jgi:uncharacterized protein (DUF885 family)
MEMPIDHQLSEVAISYGDKALFANQKDHDLYWEALLQVAAGQKEEALQLVQAIRSHSPVVLSADWQEKYPATLDGAFDKLFLSSVKRSPEFLTFLGLFESIGIRKHNAYWNDISPAAMLQDLEEKKENQKLLKRFTEIDPDHLLSYQIFSWFLNHEVKGAPFLFHSYLINQMFGPIQDITMVLLSMHPLEVKEDVETYQKRLGAIQERMDQLIQVIELQKKKGIVPPRFAIEKSVVMIERFLSLEPTKNPFYTHLVDKMGAIEMEGKEEVALATEKLIKTKVYPAYLKMKNLLVKWLEVAKENNGVWALPDGEAYYDYLLEKHTTTQLTADEVHQIGLSEVAKIEKEMRGYFSEAGIVDEKKSVGDLMLKFSENKSFYYEDTDAGRLECLAGFRAILERSRKQLWPLFNIKPKTPVELLAVPKHEEAGAPAAYYLPGSLDGARPGIFYVNLRDMQEIPKFGMETLAVHEAEPGHHFQITIQNEMQMPVFRKVLTGFTAYVEGWALYAEKLALEEGFYRTAADKLGHFQDEMMRAVRLVVDTGIHAKKWSREKAIEYMVEYTGMTHEAVVTEIERYFVLPGQACSYKIGQLKILELRKQAKIALGDKFDIREFHDLVLETGAVPLSILEKVVEAWVSQLSNLDQR